MSARTAAICSISQTHFALDQPVTKGDNNPADDLSLYNGMKYLKRSHMFVVLCCMFHGCSSR